MNRRPEMDWHAWHGPYDDPGSALARRLALVQAHIERALHAQPPGPVKLVSICAGQGHDVIGALRAHLRRPDVRARLVELDERNVAAGRRMAADAGLAEVEFMCGDATLSASYGDAIPADVVVCCGVFGNIRDEALADAIGRLPEICAQSAQIVWTRHRRAPDMSSAVRRAFEQAGFEEVAVDSGDAFAVGTHRFVGHPIRGDSDRPLFTFETDPLWLRT